MTLTETARTIFERALADCSVEKAMARRFYARDGFLFLNDEPIALDRVRRIRVIAAGKAANAMFQAALQTLHTLPDCDLAGVVVAPEVPLPLPAGFQFFPGGHPSPNEASFAGARAALDLLRPAALDASSTLCLFLISGGASAMLELPLDPAITVEETAAFHRALVASGASITEINCVRKHFSAVKGGRLAQAAGDALCRSILISDVPAGKEDAISSGPTLPDSTTLDQCRGILVKYRLLPQFPATVRHFFESEKLRETPKPENFRSKFCLLLGSNDLEQLAARHAETLGWTAVIDNHCDDWDYEDAAKYLLNRLRNLREQHARICLLSAGEITVVLPQKSAGAGGRNQQFALYAATLLTPEDGAVAVLSVGSDGIDGNSPAAGAVIDQEMVANDRTGSLRALADFDAYPFLAARNAAIVTGPSGNNLRDLRILLAQS